MYIGYYGTNSASTSNPGGKLFSSLSGQYIHTGNYLFTRFYGAWSNGSSFDLSCTNYYYWSAHHGYDHCHNSYYSKTLNSYSSLHYYHFTEVQVWEDGNGYLQGFRLVHRDST